MKNGFLYFLFFDRVYLVARCALLPLILALCFFRVGIGIWIFFAVLFFIDLALVWMSVLLPAPRDKHMYRYIDEYEAEFNQTVRLGCADRGSIEATSLKAFSTNEQMMVGCRIGSQMIFTRLVMLASVRSKRGLELFIDSESLLRANDTKKQEIKIESPSDLVVSAKTFDTDFNIVEVVLTYREERIVFLAKNDYYLRSFIESLEKELVITEVK